MQSVGRPTWAEIDLSAIKHNVTALKSLIPPATRFCAVVKADGYGHGALAVAHEALTAGADYLAVAVLNEALELRSAGVTAPILILGYTPPAQSHLVAENDLTQTIYNLDQAQALAGAAGGLGLTAKAHLKVDTGMSRLGVPPGQAADLAVAANGLTNLLLEGIYTHFASADGGDLSSALKQWAAFQEALESLSRRGLTVPIRHAANSAAIMQLPQTHLDMVRGGISLYGLYPSPDCARPVTLSPALRFKTRLTQLKKVPAGTAVSYGGTYVTPQAAEIAALPVGYADGWPRGLSGQGQVLVGGHRAPVIGRICMDQCSIEISHIPGLSEGDEVLLFGGPDLPVEEVADRLKTINYEIICQINHRVPRIYLKG